ncbi:type 1 glutamine amidotransferase [Halegenticoccus soli]|uniref:type 1 glutamine amidotransferase n=1 Tax=Halegenticoccus soli TaxID=1985678 RepID=UPI000C6EF172|nr:type 1 glutamine amidotransferase [Halegenticoccus soli]
MTLRVRCVQHVSFEGPGTIERWAVDRGHELTRTRLFDGDSLPSVADFDWLIVLGGPMSVRDEAEYPWLADEKALVRDAIDAGKTVVGICLGSQLIAEVLGAEVYEAERREIGWLPVEATPEAADLPPFAPLGDEYDAFHWHGETFDLPAGATRAAGTDACPNQAFVFDDRVVGLQFHLESSPETVEELLRNADEDLSEGRYVQNAATIRAQLDKAGPLESRLRTVFDGLERVRSSSGPA